MRNTHDAVRDTVCQIFKLPHSLVLGLLLLLISSLGGCRSEELPRPGTDAYLDVVVSFYTGLAAMQAGDDARARDRLTDVTRRVPGEPAGWANLGLLALRQQEFETAAERLARAHNLAPENSKILTLLGLLESGRGQPAEAIAYLRRALEQDPQDLKAMYALAQEAERLGDAEGDAEAQRMLERILHIQPDNLAVRLELIRIAARRGDIETVRSAVSHIEGRSAGWPEEVQEQFDAFREAAYGPDPRQAATHVAFLRNVLVALPEFRRDLEAVIQPVGEVGEPVLRFLRLPSPSPTPSPPDEGLTFTAEMLPGTDTQVWALVDAVYLTDEESPTLILAGSTEVRVGDAVSLPFPGGPQALAPSPNGVLAVDLDHDFRRDLVLAGAGGLRIYRQGEDGRFVDETGQVGVPAAVLNAPYTGVWAADVEIDGDLDLVFGPPEGPPRVLRNNGDGTFTAIQPFTGVTALRGFAWADLNGDGPPDAVMLDAAGRVHVFANERGGQFRARRVPEALGQVAALTVADIHSSGVMDVLALRADGALQRLSDRDEGIDFDVVEMGRWPGFPGEGAAGETGILVADFDNNGGLDVVATTTAGTQIWISDVQGHLQPIGEAVHARVFSATDLTGNGRLDLVGRTEEGRAVRLLNEGTLDYYRQVIRPRAAQALGDQRINSFGIGGEIEVRSGLLFQRQLITGPTAHFGLGAHPIAEIVRIVWPNGSVQAEYNLAPDHPVLTEQRLKGSCPFIFTWNGEEMTFVTDFLWRSPLGLAINAQETAGVVQTEDWINIRGDQLVEKDGYYDIRITADLWETHFFDHIALKVVDRPAGTAVHVDERFVIPPPELALHPTTPPQPVTRVWDDRGNEVTEVVSQVDERYLDFFGFGDYQGITRPHYIEIELGNEVPLAEGLVLIGHGWIRPTDSSINVAIGQGSHPPPQGLQLEVQDRKGNWKMVRPNLGFPAGKLKTVLIDLDGVFEPSAPRRLRLHTNLEIYWDALKWAVKQPQAELRTQRLLPETAVLRYRGFNEMYEANRSSPELAQYRIAGTTQRWRDLTGYYTRFGEVRELLLDVDDRYVIANAGDELAMRFAAPPPPPEGWVRDFVLIGAGWNKDGDYNTAFSETVLPLPSTHRPDYSTPPGRLQDDPVYQRYPEDWQRYHTRYVTPERFRNILRPGLQAGGSVP